MLRIKKVWRSYLPIVKARDLTFVMQSLYDDFFLTVHTGRFDNRGYCRGSSGGRARHWKCRCRQFESVPRHHITLGPLDWGTCCNRVASKAARVTESGSGSVVEHLLAKEGVASSNLVFRSNFLSQLSSLRTYCYFQIDLTGPVVHSRTLLLE